MYTEEQRIKQREANKRCYYKNQAKRLQQTKDYQRKLRQEVIQHYGGKCMCCGESEIAFLAIDHIDGGGIKHRNETSKGLMFYFWIRKNMYPKNLQVLCHNCNQAKSWGRQCPHELLK